MVNNGPSHRRRRALTVIGLGIATVVALSTPALAHRAFPQRARILSQRRHRGGHPNTALSSGLDKHAESADDKCCGDRVNIGIPAQRQTA